VPRRSGCAVISSTDIHAHIGAAWPSILDRLGIPGMGTKKGMPCPACGGTDRFIGDNRYNRGDFHCRGCGGHGDGFNLLMKVHGWTFTEARREVIAAAGITQDASPRSWPALEPVEAGGAYAPPAPPEVAQPTGRVRDIMRTACSPDDVPDVRAYLASRHLWPLPAGCPLMAHATAEYWHEGQRIGRYPALVAPVRDLDGELVTVQLTYLLHGRKVEQHDPRKILSALTGRHGCAVRLMPVAGDTLGVAEGTETALAAYQLHHVPVWAALSKALLARFEPPPAVRRLRIYADRDISGLEAAARLMERLQGRVTMELHTAPAPHKDWADVLTSRKVSP
jgi:putative DNA primase/helicase